MAWTPATVDKTYDNGSGPNNPVETVKGYVNDHGLFVIKERVTWQVCSPEGLCVKGLIPTRRAARELADKIGPMARYGWKRDGFHRWKREDPDGYAAMAALLKD